MTMKQGGHRALPALLSRDAAPGEARNLTDFTCRIFPAADKVATFKAQGDIHPEIMNMAMRKLKPIAALLTGKVNAEMVIGGSVPHCTLCGTGPSWGCGGYKWWRE